MSIVSNFGLWNSGTYIPFTCDIAAIAQGQTTIVTTDVDHGFVVGNTVQFVIPMEFGMRQLNKLVGLVLSITADTIQVNIDSLGFDAFIAATPPNPIIVYSPAQVLPVGDGNTGYVLPGGVKPTLQIPGTFRNTYP
jgi:hypothetical protein